MSKKKTIPKDNSKKSLKDYCPDDFIKLSPDIAINFLSKGDIVYTNLNDNEGQDLYKMFAVVGCVHDEVFYLKKGGVHVPSGADVRGGSRCDSHLGSKWICRAVDNRGSNPFIGILKERFEELGQLLV